MCIWSVSLEWRSHRLKPQGRVPIITENIPLAVRHKMTMCPGTPLEKPNASVPVVFLSCPLVKKHAELSGSFLYSQSTMKDMYSKPTNRTELSIPVKTKALRNHYIYTNRRTFGKRNNQNVPEQLDLESSFTFEIYSDYACLKVSRETLRTIDRFLEQTRSIQSI